MDDWRSLAWRGSVGDGGVCFTPQVKKETLFSFVFRGSDVAM